MKIVLAVLFALALSFTAAHAEKREGSGQKFGEWDLDCKEEPCDLGQATDDTDNDKNWVEASFDFTSKGKLRLVVEVPAEADQSEDAKVSVDGDEVKTISLECDEQSCTGEWMLDKNELQKILDGKLIGISYKSEDGDDVALDLDVKGLKRGLVALAKKTGNSDPTK